MLDLKAKLAAAGLVSPEELARAEARKDKRGRQGGQGGQGPRDKQGGRGRGGKAARGGPGKPAPALDVAALGKLEKGKQYDAVRRFVESTRLDPVARMPSEHARSFHFPTEQGGIGRLVIEPHVSHALARGEAAVVAYMSNHGLAHAVVATEGAKAIAQLFPTWLRSLAGQTPSASQEDEAVDEAPEGSMPS